MTLVVLGFIAVTLFSVIIYAISGMGDAATYPLDPGIATGIAYIFLFIKSWSSVFTALNTLIYVAGLAFSFELIMFVWRGLRWIIGVVRGSKA